MNRQYKLFFSWQSEDKKSRKTLDVALQNAVEALNDRGIRLEIDHSTLGESGMPSIDQTILRKIDACDIFLADVTPVTTYQKSSGNGMQVSKDVPNPNVLLELGYAMSALGVGYVIVAAHQGNWIPENMPFDINHRAIYSFTSSNCDLTSRILEVIEYIGLNTLQAGLGGFDTVRVDTKSQVFGLDKTVVSSGQLILQHRGVFLTDTVKGIPLGRDGNGVCKGLLRCRKVQKRQLEVNRAVEIIEEITPALKDRGLIFILGELIVDVLKLNGLCVVAVRYTADPVRPHPFIGDTVLC